MMHWSSLMVVSLAVTSSFGLPDSGEYKIPDVGNNRRSQYYVLHDDGSFKYGYDTGEDAFESLKTNVDGDAEGKFGYTDSDGQKYRIDYTSGPGGFVARGDHIPQVHPDVAAAFAAARSSKPFVDPLAGEDGDRSYQFDFDGEEHSRTEKSDSDGTVTGSYSYIDEFGRTRTYTYRAGKGIGFVIEGDDIPQQVQPLPVPSTNNVQHRTTFSTGSTQAGSSIRGSAGNSFRQQAHTQTRTNVGQTSSNRKRFGVGASTSFKASGTGASTSSRTPQSSKTYYNPQAATRASAFENKVSNINQISSGLTGGAPLPVSSTRFSSGAASLSGTNRRFEAANTRTSFTPSGGYSVAYETSSHSRQEDGDDDNNVRGQFRFTSDDDDVERSVSYTAGSATGFIAQGAHLPIGPPVPGANSGQVTGRFDAVERSNYVDPLADDDTDASYNFEFGSDTYSRSETADEDGNVSGTYSVLGEDGVMRTYKFRAGKGVGFETEEVSAIQTGRRPTTQSQRASSVSGTSSASVARAGVTSYKAPANTFSAHSSRASAQSSSAARSGNKFNFSPQTRNHGASTAGTGFSTTKFSHNVAAHGASAGRVSGVQGSSRLLSGQNENRRFTLHSYDSTDDRGKYGYVLRFDD